MHSVCLLFGSMKQPYIKSVLLQPDIPACIVEAAFG